MLAYEQSGDGQPLVLVHGLATTRVVWRRVVPLLARERRVVALDVPGFGASAPAGRGFDLARVADRIVDGLASIGRPFSLVGHSLGGAVALTIAARHPQAVDRLVLVAPAGLRPVARPAALIAGRASEPLIALRRAGAPLADFAWARRLMLAGGTVDGAAMPPAETRALVQASRGARRIAEGLAAVAGADLRPLLDGLVPPLGLIWGAGDRVVPPSRATEVLDRRPGTPLVTIPHAGHIAMAEQPERFASELLGLLKALETS